MKLSTPTEDSTIVDLQRYRKTRTQDPPVTIKAFGTPEVQKRQCSGWNNVKHSTKEQRVTMEIICDCDGMEPGCEASKTLHYCTDCIQKVVRTVPDLYPEGVFIRRTFEDDG